MKHTSEEAQSRAEASFKKKERQAIEGAKAMAEYQAQMLAVRDRTARLRALRLAREAEQAQRADGRATRTGAGAAAARR